ncbi:unnamed protein product [Linum trigynum]|uniref:Uncharacterized protein n=1 Tax=Linum trigynum TaxID=586398 RepID=A0AAV2FAL4_9ROSI
MGRKPAVSLRIASSLVLIILAVFIACMLTPGESRTSPSVQVADLRNKQLAMGDANVTNYSVEQEDSTPGPACTDSSQCINYCYSKNPELDYHCGGDGKCFCSWC